MFSQDKVFSRLVVGLPPALKEALLAAELLDPGLLKAYPRSDWAVLATAERKDVLVRGTHAAAALSSSTTGSSYSRPISSTFSPCFPVPSQVMVDGTGLGISVGDPVVVLCDSGVSSSVASSVVGRVSPSILDSGVSADTSARSVPQVPGAVTTALSTEIEAPRVAAERVPGGPSPVAEPADPVANSGSQSESSNVSEVLPNVFLAVLPFAAGSHAEPADPTASSGSQSVSRANVSCFSVDGVFASDVSRLVEVSR